MHSKFTPKVEVVELSFLQGVRCPCVGMNPAGSSALIGHRIQIKQCDGRNVKAPEAPGGKRRADLKAVKNVVNQRSGQGYHQLIARHKPY